MKCSTIRNAGILRRFLLSAIAAVFASAAVPAFVMAAVIAFWACEKNDENPQITKGRVVYLSNCTACHNSNPALDGSVGPSIKGSSIELLSARIRNQSYPDSYKPKRSTQIMPKLALSDADIAALAEFLK